MFATGTEQTNKQRENSANGIGQLEIDTATCDGKLGDLVPAVRRTKY